ncbi:synaptic vesicle glycoprotein 2C [Caerostris extrusa]|uniref:Synaptic vesicle glycoprotein 2C n=1 Tax=Caerostris extrusa TaxID=172846 RepID=A0AAV4U5L6_CAEEX|nr:synaptic vesicle glycoprotein 2C [Caerostris extrusa]
MSGGAKEAADPESESLLLRGREGSTYTEEGAAGAAVDVTEMDYVDADVSVLSQFHEDALAQAGFGLFHYFLFLVLGLGLAADSIEVFVIAYVLPSAERELCMDDTRKGWLVPLFSFYFVSLWGKVRNPPLPFRSDPFSVETSRNMAYFTVIKVHVNLNTFVTARAELLQQSNAISCFFCSLHLLPGHDDRRPGVGQPGRQAGAAAHPGLRPHHQRRVCRGGRLHAHLRPSAARQAGERHRSGRFPTHRLYLLRRVSGEAPQGTPPELAAHLLGHRGLFTALMAWLMIAQPGTQGLGTRLSSWRVFLVVCSAPALLTVFGLFFLPESPRFLLESGQDVEAMYVYQKVFRINHRQNDEYPLSEMELPARQIPPPGSSPVGCLTDTLEAFETVSFLGLLRADSVGPVHQDDNDSSHRLDDHCFRILRHVHLVSRVPTPPGGRGAGGGGGGKPDTGAEEIHGSDTGQTIREGALRGRPVRGRHLQPLHFRGMRVRRVRVPEGALVRDFLCQVHIQEGGLRGRRTDLYSFRFVDCVFVNSSFRQTVEDECGLDLDLTTDLSDVFQENLIAQAALLPGNIVSLLRPGQVWQDQDNGQKLSIFFYLKWITPNIECSYRKCHCAKRVHTFETFLTSLFLTSCSALFIWFLDTRTAVIAFEALFNFIAVSGWNAVDVVTTESYPPTLRATGYGFLSAASRLAAIAGHMTFARFIGVSRALPVLTTAAALMGAALAALGLKETKDALM